MRPKLFSISLLRHMYTGCRKIASKSASKVNANGEMIHGSNRHQSVGTRVSEPKCRNQSERRFTEPTFTLPERRNQSVGTRMNVGLRYQSFGTRMNVGSRYQSFGTRMNVGLRYQSFGTRMSVGLRYQSVGTRASELELT